MSDDAGKIYAELAQRLGVEQRAEAAEAKKNAWSRVLAKRNGTSKTKTDGDLKGWKKVVAALNARQG